MQSLMIQTQSHRRQTPCPNADSRAECAESSPQEPDRVAGKSESRGTLLGTTWLLAAPSRVRAWTPPCAQQGRITSVQGMRRFWWRIPRTIGSSSPSKALCPYQLEARGYALLCSINSPKSGSATCTR